MKEWNIKLIIKEKSSTHISFEKLADIAFSIYEKSGLFQPVIASDKPPIKGQDGLWYYQYQLLDNREELIKTLKHRYDSLKSSSRDYSIHIYDEHMPPTIHYNIFRTTFNRGWTTYIFGGGLYRKNDLLDNYNKMNAIVNDLSIAGLLLYSEIDAVIGGIGSLNTKWFLDKNPDNLELINLNWVNFLGSEYVERYGKYFLMNAPGYKIEEMPGGGIFYQLSEEFININLKENSFKEEVIKYFENHPKINTIEYTPIYFKESKKPKKYGVSGKFSPEKLKKSAESLAKDFEKEFKIKLDFSTESIKKLDVVISESFDPNSNLAPVVAFDVGTYLGEVIIRNIGGKWKVEDDPYDCKIVDIPNIKEIYPMQKALKRWEGGETEALDPYIKSIAKYAGVKLNKKKRWLDRK